MCYSTLVLDDPKYGAMPGVEYYEIETKMGTFKYAQSPQGVVPALLEDLAAFRKQAKRDMAAAKARGDDWAASLFNAKQLAYKITMNSAYGFLGASKGMLPIVPIAASVTATGRAMIQKTKELAESMVPGSRVIYGDSVAGHTPVMVRAPGGGPTEVTSIQRLCTEWEACGDKEVGVLPGALEVWSDDGWTTIHRVIRHRLGKRLVRVETAGGLVDVTTDHSLLLSDGMPITPLNARVGTTRLMHAEFPEFVAADPLCNSDEAFDLGFELFESRVPAAVLGASHEVREAYFFGVRVRRGWNSSDDAEADASKGAKVQVECVTQHAALTHMILGTSLGYHTSIRYAPDCARYVVAVVSKSSSLATDSNMVAHLSWTLGEDYVYDLTTSNHHFAAGAGKLVVHNTDSVMVIFNVERGNLEKHFEVAQRVADEISKTFKPPNDLEFEKCYYPYLLFSKKRYAGADFFFSWGHPK